MPEAKIKILVVDDDLRLRDLLDRYLAEQGFAVRSAGDAAAEGRTRRVGWVQDEGAANPAPATAR